MNKETIIHQYDFNLAYAQALVAHVSEDEMTLIPAAGLVNHPAFTLGHLVSGSALVAKYLGGTYEMPEGWEALFLRRGPGDPRTPDMDTTKYPSKYELLDELEAQHEKVKALLLTVEDSMLNAPKKWRFSSMMPTLLDSIVFMCINHEAMHLGQLAAWRRAMGKDSALAAI